MGQASDVMHDGSGSPRLEKWKFGQSVGRGGQSWGEGLGGGAMTEGKGGCNCCQCAIGQNAQ